MIYTSYSVKDPVVAGVPHTGNPCQRICRWMSTDGKYFTTNSFQIDVQITKLLYQELQSLQRRSLEAHSRAGLARRTDPDQVQKSDVVS